jgi:hypothetical protein
LLFLGTMMINPFRTTLARLALSSGSLIRAMYNSQCGPTCPSLTDQAVNTWRLPLEQPGFSAELAYTLSHGIASMTPAEFRALKAARVPKLVIAGASDPQMSRSDADVTARRIGAPSPVYVPGRHLTMIASPRQLAAAIGAFHSALR